MVKFSCATRRFYLFVGQIEIIRFFLPLKFTFCWVKSPFWCGKQQLLLLNKSREIQDLVAQYPHIFPPSFRLANSIFAHWIHDFCWLNLIIVKFIDEHSISIFSPIGFGANPKKHACEIPLLDAKTQYCGGVCFRLFSFVFIIFPIFSSFFLRFFNFFHHFSSSIFSFQPVQSHRFSRRLSGPTCTASWHRQVEATKRVVDHEELKNSWIMLDCTGWGAPVW